MNVHAVPRPTPTITNLEHPFIAAFLDLEAPIADTYDLMCALVELMEDMFDHPASETAPYKSFTFLDTEIGARLAILYAVHSGLKDLRDKFHDATVRPST